MKEGMIEEVSEVEVNDRSFLFFQVKSHSGEQKKQIFVHKKRQKAKYKLRNFKEEI